MTRQEALEVLAKVCEEWNVAADQAVDAKTEGTAAQAYEATGRLNAAQANLKRAAKDLEEATAQEHIARLEAMLTQLRHDSLDLDDRRIARRFYELGARMEKDPGTR